MRRYCGVCHTKQARYKSGKRGMMPSKKKGFVSLVEMLLAGQIKRLAIIHKDRLLRFGSEIVLGGCKAMNVRGTILEESRAKSQAKQWTSTNPRVILFFRCNGFCARVFRDVTL